MATAAVQKFCVACGDNVANKPRTKDQQGRYYCNQCWAGRSVQASQQPTKPVGAHEVQTDDPLAALAAFVQPNETRDAPLEPGRPSTESETSDLMNCPDCGGWFAEAQMSTSGVCKRCHAGSSTKIAKPRLKNGSSRSPKIKFWLIGLAAAVFLTATAMFSYHWIHGSPNGKDSNIPHEQLQACLHEIAVDPDTAFKRFAGAVVDNLNANMAQVLATLKEKPNGQLDPSRPLIEQTSHWPDGTKLLPEFAYHIQRPDGVLPLAADLIVTRRHGSDLGHQNDDGTITWKKVIYDTKVDLRFVWEDNQWQLRKVDDEEKGIAANLDLKYVLQKQIEGVPNPTPADVAPVSHPASADTNAANTLSDGTNRQPVVTNPTPDVGATRIAPGQPVAIAPPSPDMKLDDRDVTDPLLAISGNVVTLADQYGADPKNGAMLAANGGDSFELHERGKMANGNSFISASRVFGEPEVLILSPAPDGKPCLVDFSKLTLGRKGTLSIKLHNFPGGGSHARTLIAGTAIDSCDVAKNSWRLMNIPFDNQPVICEITAPTWYCVTTFLTYSFSADTLRSSSSSTASAALQPAPIQAATSSTSSKIRELLLRYCQKDHEKDRVQQEIQTLEGQRDLSSQAGNANDALKYGHTAIDGTRKAEAIVAEQQQLLNDLKQFNTDDFSATLAAMQRDNTLPAEDRAILESFK